MPGKEYGERGGSPCPRQYWRTSCLNCRMRPSLFLTHGIAEHLDAMGIVNKPVENAIGGGSVTDLLMPSRNRQLRGD